MKTNEERLALIEKKKKEILLRNAEIRRTAVRIASFAVCFCFVIFIGLYFSSLGIVSSAEYTQGQTASLIAEGGSVGYVLVGLICFLLGVCLTLLMYKLRGNSNDMKR